jgi:hypothetical protein
MRRTQRLALTLMLALPPIAAPALAADRPTDERSCSEVLNELAAAAVFSDLAEEQMEQIYGLLDQLQDNCDAADYAAAGKTIEALEAKIGR